jgi:CheY-like chemotaxis protein
MPHGGILTISAENAHLDDSYARMHPEAKPGPYLLFSVSDTGTGIPAPILDRIFDPFFTTKERGHGTGLGLSTVHSIVKGHGGFVTVYSELGKGSHFRVYLPASPAGAVQLQPTEAIPSASGQGELILIVEDEAPIREVIQEALEAHGYRALIASDGSEAIALFARQPDEIRLVITDLAMPIMDGVATIRALQKIRPEVKILAVSGMAWDKAGAGAESAAVKAFLQKPFAAERLLQTLAEVLRAEVAAGKAQ